MTTSNDLRSKLQWCNVPEQNHEGLLMYIEHGVPTGSFLRNVLENNLRTAFATADEQNRRSLFQTVAFLEQYAPTACWGSEEAVSGWLEAHRKQRQAEKDSVA